MRHIEENKMKSQNQNTKEQSRIMEEEVAITPEKIFLQAGAEGVEVTWCESPVNGWDVEYLRKDVVIAAMKKMRDKACEYVGECMAMEDVEHTDLVELQVDIHNILLEGFFLKKQ